MSWHVVVVVVVIVSGGSWEKVRLVSESPSDFLGESRQSIHTVYLCVNGMYEYAYFENWSQSHLYVHTYYHIYVCIGLYMSKHMYIHMICRTSIGIS